MSEPSSHNLNSSSSLLDDIQKPLQKMLYTRKNAAVVLSLSVRALDYLIATKKLNTIRVGRKVLLGHRELVKFSRRNSPTPINDKSSGHVM
jgi:hypothetical protein